MTGVMEYRVMSERNELKQRLPFPYCHDLSQILRSLNRRTRRGRERIANDPVTAGYLASAIRLVKRYLGRGAGFGAPGG
jgi:hypothetical protein